MKVVLAEKPSVARELAQYLRATSRKEGYFEGNGYQVTWALGHLLELKEPGDYDLLYKKWSLKTLPIIPLKFQLKPRGDSQARQQLGVVKRLFRNADKILCATDAGREGELIFRYILQDADCTSKPVSRLWLKSLTPQAIRSAFQDIRPLAEYDGLYAAAKCRSEADWIIGMNATRFYTLSHGSSDLLFSIGRVQTPVLAMIVQRDDEIRTFKPQPFWELSTEYRTTKFRHIRDSSRKDSRFEKEEEAEAVFEQINGHDLEIKRVQRKPQQSQPPQLFDLTELQRAANRRYGLAAARTLSIAQTLYERKLISYPRTDSRYLSSDMRQEVSKIFKALHSQKANEIDKLDLDNLLFSNRVVNDGKVEDHHAIIPTGTEPSKLDATQRKIYDAIVTRFIAAFYPPCEKEITDVAAESNGVQFSARGVRVVSTGWTELYPQKSKQQSATTASATAETDKTQALPNFVVGERGKHQPFVKRGETVPPKHFTENTLLGAMETAGRLVQETELREALKDKGLGTPATRAAIIEILVHRCYIERLGIQLTATDLGRYLVARLKEPSLRSPRLTGDWEAQLKQIERSSDLASTFMDGIVAFAKQITDESTGKIATDRWGECPRCGKAVIKGKRGYGCSGWRDDCKFVVWPTYDGHDLNETQVRELLQLGSTKQTSANASGEKLLSLVTTGAIVEVPSLSDSQQNQAKSGSTKTSTTRQGSGTGKGSGSVELGVCPECGKQVVEQKKSYSCSAWREGCGFVIWKTISGKRISRRTAKQLLTQQKTAVMKGFKSRNGKPFQARLKLVGSRVEYEFDSS